MIALPSKLSCILNPNHLNTNDLFWTDKPIITIIIIIQFPWNNFAPHTDSDNWQAITYDLFNLFYLQTTLFHATITIAFFILLSNLCFQELIKKVQSVWEPLL